MAHVSSAIVGASPNVAVAADRNGAKFRPGTVVEVTDNSKAIYAVASGTIAAGTATCTVTRAGEDNYTATGSAGSLTCVSGAAAGEGAWFIESGVVTAS